VLIDSLAKLNSNSRNAISAVLIVIVAIAVYGWTVAPHVTHLSAVQRYESVVDDVVKKNKILSSAVKTKKKKLEQLQEQFAQLQGSLFMVDKAKEFFSDLQAISVQAGCTVYSLNLVTSEQNSQDGPAEGRETTSGIVTKSAVLSVIGAYGDIIKLMEKLQAREQKVWIDSVRMTSLDSPASGGQASNQLKCDITITICTIPSISASAGISLPLQKQGLGTSQDKEAVSHE